MNSIPSEKIRKEHRKIDPGDRMKALREQTRKSIFRIRTDRAVQARLLTALLFVCIGAGLGEMSRRYGIQQAQKEQRYSIRQELETVEAMSALQTEEAAAPPAALEKEETRPEERPYEPSPDRLNLAYYYPEDSQGEDIIDSYAGQVFQELTIRDSEWLADIYELADIRPAAMAARLGRDPSSVIGKYDPKNEDQDPDDPSTWSVDNWKKIHVSFLDGDGRASTSYSNVKEILAMASVYTYYKDLMDVEAFRAYAVQLWEDSHSYSLRMGDLYHCDGCIDKTDEEIAQEAIEDEEGAASLAVPEDGDGTAFGDSQELLKSDGGSDGGAARETKSRSSSGSSSDPVESGSPSTESDGQSEQAAREALVDGAAATETAPPSDEGEPSGESVTVIRRAKKPAGAEDQTEGGAGEAGTDTLTEGISGGGGGGREEELEQPAVIRRTKKDLETAESLEGMGAASDSDAQPAAVEEETTSDPPEGQADAAGEKQADSREDLSRSADESAYCPGHVDLYIQVKLLGLEGRNSLLARDKIGNGAIEGTKDQKEDGSGDRTEAGAEEEKVEGWDGWTEANIAHVKAICAQDWFEDYGLSISSISLSTPLSAQEIESYMEQLPEDLSETRKRIVRFALSSVGKVPYYWGGKASHPGYEGNGFGMLVPSDDKGRILKGLDCSGWISWVYWSVTGKRLEGSSTSGLILCGEKISRSELKPGDIVVRTGTNAHVVMFLSWSANGQMNVIHESSASVNNVTIKTMDAAWPYYRRLVE